MTTQMRSHESHPFGETPQAKKTQARAPQLAQGAHPKLHREAKSTGSPPTSAATDDLATLQAQRVQRVLSAAQPPAPKEDSLRLHMQSAIPLRLLPTARAAFCERSRQSLERAE